MDSLTHTCSDFDPFCPAVHKHSCVAAVLLPVYDEAGIHQPRVLWVTFRTLSAVLQIVHFALDFVHFLQRIASPLLIFPFLTARDIYHSNSPPLPLQLRSGVYFSDVL